MADIDDDLGGMPTNPAPAAVIPVATGLAPGRVLAGRYEIVTKLGHGGMGAVFRARDLELGEDVALKVILPERIVDPGALERFRREVKLARKITHPNVCRVFDTGEEGSLRFLTMEFVAGRSLRELLAKGPLDPARAMAILHQIIQGVAAAHAQGIVHRDLKPDNVLIRDGGQAVVADFGLAHTPASGQTTESKYAGTPSYMSPEQLRGEALDGRSDIFALGIVAYEMLTGRLPFPGDSPATIASAILRDAPAPLELPELPIEMQQGIKAAIFRALEKNPENRFDTATEFGEALVASGAEHSAPTMMRGSSVPAPVSATPKGRMRLGVLIGVASSLALTALLWRPWQAATNAQQRMPLPTPVVSASSRGPLDIVAVSKNPQAESLFRQAKLAMHDGRVEQAIATMTRAVTIDPDFAAAELRLAIWMLLSNPHEARPHQLAAIRLRETLSEHDQAMLHAMDAWLEQPPDIQAWEADLEALAQKYPNDMEALLLVAGVRIFRMRVGAAVEAANRALETDRTHALAWTMKADALSLSGDTRGQFEAYRECLTAAPTAAKCLRDRIRLRARLGECTLMKDDAKHLLTLEPDASATHRLVADALESTGEPRESVVDALEKSFSLQTGPERAAAELKMRMSLAIRYGDFMSAVRMLEEQSNRAARDTNQESHAVPAFQLALMYLEMGLSKKADAIAVDYLRRKEAWIEDIDNDWGMRFIVVRLRAGKISAKEFAKQRDEWADKFRKKWIAAGRKESDDLEWLIWSQAYGFAAETKKEAEEALAKMPQTRGPAVESGRLGTDFFQGKVYALAGEHAKAAPLLQRAASACNVLEDPLTPMHARLYLGMAADTVGVSAGVFGALGLVMQRWGKAEPKSVTAERAKELLKKHEVSSVIPTKTEPVSIGKAIETRR